MAEKLMHDDAGAVVAAILTAAKGGDMTAARLVLERILPARKGCPVVVALPDVQTATDVPSAFGAIVAAVARGDLTPEEAAAIGAVLEAQRRAIETADHEQRLSALEAERGKAL